MKIWMKKKKRWIACLLAALLILGAVPVKSISQRVIGFADEEGGEPEPTPTPTPTPTDPPTPKPTDPPTPKPTDVPTPVPTDPPTVTDPPTQTDSPTDDPTTEAPSNPTESGNPENPNVTDPPEGPGESENPGVTETPGTDNTTSPSESEGPGTEPSEEPGVEETPEPTATDDPNLEDQSPDPVEPDGKMELKPKSKYAGWYGVVNTSEQGMPIPILYQTDYPTVVCTIRGLPRSVATSGCGATSVSMVIAYLTGNTEQNPYSLFYHCAQVGRYNGAGLDHDTLSYLCNMYGVHTKWIRNDGDAIKQALNEGKPVVAHMGPGIFTRGGHYVVLRGVASDGKILLNDPVSPIKTHRKFPIETLLTQAKNRTAFMVCWVDEPDPTPAPIEDRGEKLNEAEKKNNNGDANDASNALPGEIAGENDVFKMKFNAKTSKT